MKMKENGQFDPRYDETEREMRKLAKQPLSVYEKAGIASSTLSDFESGKREISFRNLQACLEIANVSMDDFVSVAEQKSYYKRYGEIFQELREQRELSYVDFATLGLSAYVLEKFEMGQVMLDFDKLDAALQIMHVSLADYSYLINNGREDYFTAVLDRIEDDVAKGDKDNLIQIYTHSNNSSTSERMLALAAKSHLVGLTDEEQEEISGFLMAVDVWTNFEIALFFNLLDQLTSLMIACVTGDFTKDIKSCVTTGPASSNLAKAFLFACIRLVDEGNADATIKILKTTEKLFGKDDCYVRSIHCFATAYYRYRIVHDSEGLINMKKIISYMNFIEAKATAEQLQGILSKVS